MNRNPLGLKDMEEEAKKLYKQRLVVVVMTDDENVKKMDG